MALSEEELLQQVNILATKTSDNAKMVYSTIPALNKGLNPDAFSGNNSKIVNAINKLAEDVAGLSTSVVDMINKTNSVLMDTYSTENNEFWEETKELMNENTIIEGIRSILEGQQQDKILNIQTDDVGKILSISLDENGKPIVQPIDMPSGGSGDNNINIDAYAIPYTNEKHEDINNVGNAIDKILLMVEDIKPEINWEDINNKPAIGNNLMLDDDSLSLMSDEDELSSVPLMSNEDIDAIVDSLD